MKGRCLDIAKENVVWVSGSGRSGTSWLANLINYRNDFRYIFEPFNPHFLPYEDSDIDWAPDPELSHGLLEAAVTGKVSTKWVNSRNQKWVAGRRLVKAIRSNMMVPWINNNHPSVKVVLLIRNPLAVAASRKKLSLYETGNWEWRPSPDILLEHPWVKSRLSSQEHTLLVSQLGRGVVFETIVDWIITNLLAFRSLDLETNHLVFYEKLVSKDSEVIEKLFNFVQVKRTPDMEVYFAKKSDTTRVVNDSLKLSNPLEAWRSVLNEQEIRQAQDVLVKFGIDRFYSESFQPKRGPA